MKPNIWLRGNHALGHHARICKRSTDPNVACPVKCRCWCHDPTTEEGLITYITNRIAGDWPEAHRDGYRLHLHKCEPCRSKWDRILLSTKGRLPYELKTGVSHAGSYREALRTVRAIDCISWKGGP